MVELPRRWWSVTARPAAIVDAKSQDPIVSEFTWIKRVSGNTFVRVDLENESLLNESDKVVLQNLKNLIEQMKEKL